MKDIILKVLNDYFQHTTGDVKDYDIENCARDIVEALEAAQPQRAADSSKAVATCPRCSCIFDVDLPAKSG